MTLRRSASRALVALALFAAAVAHAAGFDLTDTQGGHHRLADYRGRWVVVNFWATWCVPCIREIPEIAAFARAHPEVVVIGVAVDVEDPRFVERVASGLGIAYPLVLSDDAVERQLGHPPAIPTTRIYDPEGRVTYDRVGRVDRRMLESATRSGTAGGAGRAST